MVGWGIGKCSGQNCIEGLRRLVGLAEKQVWIRGQAEAEWVEAIWAGSRGIEGAGVTRDSGG